MRTATCVGRFRALTDALADALGDARRRDRTLTQVLFGYAVLWALYGVLAKGSQDIHFDMGEAVAWSRELAFGTPKHPPLSAWLVKVWFAIFPLADWAYYFLAMLVATAGLAVAWVISGHYLDGDKRIAGLALMTLVPFFNFHALKFNANTVLIPLWALTTHWFLDSFRTHRLRSAALAGLAAAAAMYGKYWSAVLLIGLGLAVLADPRRRAYFRSPAPWVTIAVGALALSPHVAWLFANDFAPVHFAFASHAAGGAAATFKTTANFAVGAMAYAAVPVAAALLIARPSPADIADTLWPRAPDRRLAVAVFWAPFLVAVIAAFFADAAIVPLWAMPAFTLLPVVLFSSPRVAIPRAALNTLVAVTIAFPMINVLAAPAIAYVIHRIGVPHYATHYRLLAAAIDRTWDETTAQPLRLVGSGTNIVNGVAFYLADRPSTYELLRPALTPWASTARIEREGIALVCAVDEPVCLNALEAMTAHSPPGRRVEVEIARRYISSDGHPQRYVIVTIPPDPALIR